jgi:4-hydroxybenzoate polyprenyltransferase
MGQVLWELFKTARPRQVIKNLALFVAIVFNGWLFLPDKFLTVAKATIIFSLLASSVYLFNDLMDAPRDRLHPLKKNRPIAAGRIPPNVALATSIGLLLFSLILALKLSQFFFFACLTYSLLQFVYTVWLKHLPIIDVLAIASGFVLRVYAGALVIEAHINAWLLLCIVSFSLFLAIGKRRSELTLLTQSQAGQHRQVLFSYPEKLLDNYVSMFANTTWLTYALFTFMYPVRNIHSPMLIDLITDLPQTFTLQKWLMITIPVVIFGVMRYLWIIYQKEEGDSPEKVLLKDKQLLVCVLLWGLMVVGIIYG